MYIKSNNILNDKGFRKLYIESMFKYLILYKKIDVKGRSKHS